MKIDSTSLRHYKLNEEGLEPFPHQRSCETCRRFGVCNFCGGKAPKQTRCTNGRCDGCCRKQCQHVTQ